MKHATKPRFASARGIALLAGLLPLATARAAAVNETVIHDFGADPSGAEPWAPLVFGADGALYGTAPLNGPYDFNGQQFLGGYGTVYGLDTAGAFTLLHAFDPSGSACEGAIPGPGALLQTADGAFYGTTLASGDPAAPDGSVFEVAADGTLVTLHSFNGDDGFTPMRGVVDGHDGYLYGLTYGTGGNVAGADVYGTAYRITTDGSLTTLYRFSGDSHSAYPVVLIRGQDGNFYGSTNGTGTSGDYGSIFRLSPQGDLTTLHRFADDSDGVVLGLAQGRDGNLYGVRSHGTGIGVSAGLTPCNSGGSGRGQAGGMNTLTMAAAPTATSGLGAVFRLTLAGRYSVLHEFSGTDGADPAGNPLQARDGDFYGTTINGGANGLGTVYRISRRGRFALLYSFQGTPDGANPAAGLVEDPAAPVLYGTSFRGGADNLGTAFKLSLGR